MSEMGPNKASPKEILQGLRKEFTRQAEQAGTIEAVAGGPVDRDLPPDYWRFSDTDLENELWSRIPGLDRAMLDLGQSVDILPSCPLPAKPGLAGKIKGIFKNLMLRLAMPLVRITLEKQDRLNRIALEKQNQLNGQLKHLQFIQFLTVKQLRERLQRLEMENRELRGRLAELETENVLCGEATDHE